MHQLAKLKFIMHKISPVTLQIITTNDNIKTSQDAKLSSYIFTQSLIARAQRDNKTNCGLLYRLVNVTNDIREVFIIYSKLNKSYLSTECIHFIDSVEYCS